MMKKQFIWITCLLTALNSLRAQGPATTATPAATGTTAVSTTVQVSPTATTAVNTTTVVTITSTTPQPTPAPAPTPTLSKPFPLVVIASDEKLPDYYTQYSYISLRTSKEGYVYALQHKDSLRLFINGILYPNIKPAYFNLDSTAVVFKMNYDTAQASPWKIYYAFPNYWSVSHGNTEVSMAFPHSSAMIYGTPTVELHTSAYFRIFMAYAIFILIIFLVCNHKVWKYNKTILRDVALYAQNGVMINDLPTSVENGTINYKEIPFSLARSQFLMWLVLIFLGILHIWGFTSILTEPTGSVLTLLGISGTTFYLGKVLDTAPSNNNPPPADPNNPNAAKQAAVQAFITENKKSKGFVNDILYDGNTISLHRLQLFMFTVFLGVYFLCAFVTNLALPSFSPTLMALMGISSATYAGLKTTES